MKITDGKKTVEIKMQVWTGNGYTPDFSLDFFDAGALPWNDEKDVYTVESVEYCIGQAQDWENSTGDFCDDTPSDDNTVTITEL